MPQIVMFRHSPDEYSPKIQGVSGLCNWNATTKHFRRFLLSVGDYVDSTNTLQSGDLLFWSEWEACTWVRKLLPKRLHCATWLHEPIYPTACPPSAGGGCLHRQNTDPCVFGDSFKYALCLQQTCRQGRVFSTKMQQLDSGSLIFFGGTRRGTFFLDTVFVVGEKTPYVGPDWARAVQCSNAYRILTLNQTQGKLSFYRGITWSQREQHNGLYSFAPGKVLQNRATLNTLSVAFRNRCVLNFGPLNQIVQNVSTKQFGVSQNFTAINAPLNVVQLAWNELLHQVKANGFVPCVHFQWPQQNQTPNRMAHATAPQNTSAKGSRIHPSRP